MGDEAGRMCPEALAEVLKGLLIFRDALVSILLKNAIAPSQEEYSVQYDKVQCSNFCMQEWITQHSSEYSLLKEVASNYTTHVSA